jgi:hypothetical protein
MAMVDNGDASDSNGGGLRWDCAGTFVDVTRETSEDVTERVPMADGLYVPQGRAWEIVVNDWTHAERVSTGLPICGERSENVCTQGPWAGHVLPYACTRAIGHSDDTHAAGTGTEIAHTWQ